MKYYDAKFVRAQFDSAKGFVGYCVDAAVENADRALALVIYRALIEKARYLDRKFGFSAGEQVKGELPAYKAPAGGAAP